MSTEYDDLRSQLESLNDAVRLTGLPGPAAARARGIQRSRRYAAGVVMGVAVVLAGGTLAVGQLANTPGVIEPAAPPTSPAEPSPSAVDLALLEVPAAALMTVDDIVDDRHVSTAGFGWVEADEDRPSCVPVPDDAEVVDQGQTSYAADNTPADFVAHDVYLIESGAAADVFDRLVAEVPDCQDATVQVAGPLGNVGDEGYLTQYVYPGDGTVTWLAEFSLIRHGDVVSVVTRWMGTQDYPGDPDLVTPANAAERMCATVYGESCVTGEPVLESQDAAAGPHEIADEPFLTDDQVNPIGSRDRFVPGELSEGIDRPQWSDLCFDDLDGLDSVQEIRHRAWNDTNDASLFQSVLRFADAETADQWLRDYTVIDERCAAFNVDDNYGSVTDYGVLELPSGADALAWSIYYAPPDAGAGFSGAAIARRDNIVVIVTYGAMDGPEGPTDWVEYVTPRLTDALVNAVGGAP